MKKILAVDDSSAITVLLERILLKKYEIKIAVNGQEALNTIQEWPPDLVLMDLIMPVMDGITAIKAIRKMYDGARLPIIVLSGVDEKAKCVEALDIGANDFVSKPFDKNELLSRIATNINISHLTNELAKKNELLQEEKSLARKIQESILTQSFNFDCLEIGNFYRASDQIGGDFYDAWNNKNKNHILIGDVSGHGTGSALLMAACKGIFYTLGQTIEDPKIIMAEANRIICQMVGNSAMFVTLAYIVFDQSKNQIETVSAGHNPVFLLNGSKIQPITSTGTPLGFFNDGTWTSNFYNLAPGNVLFLYTDGLVEAKNSQNEFYGEERLLSLLQNGEWDSVPSMIQSIFNDAEKFTGGIFLDDVTMFAVKRFK